MKFIQLDGAQVPALGYGTYQLQGRACVHGVRTALDVGYRHLDTASMYENERDVGRALSESGVSRDEVFLTTKVWRSDLAAPAVRKSLERSLKALETDYVDLLLIHWPDPSVPLSETLEAMAALQSQRKVRYVGVSNFPVALMREAVAKSPVPIACNQVEYHPGLSQDKVLAYARSQGVFVTAYSPLAQAELMHDELLKGIGGRHGKTAAQVALRWLMDQDGVAAVPKASREPHIRQNFDIFDFALTDDERAQIGAIGGNARLISPSWGPQWDS